ncbi:Serine carboxypeptidases (lysosomal cathepsin A) [Handroanthus impetiginosus]|uniref:Carboxypeptidase n=1 Tax=Handroanthus impetiginosus TaxID=429701 RepID=A0A2G9HKP4_9LAMI|nr:Serine carboxypeptidases (lysosomal cathepsin A) [Handroanthus impetiginosus]
MKGKNMALETLLSHKIFLSFFFIFHIAFNTCTNSANIGSEEYEYDRIIKLPGQPTTPRISQFSGYITVNEAHGRALYYWFFEAQSEPIKKPLLLWLNGGPGCSSIGYGASVELGPLRVAKEGDFLKFNQHAWNKEANLLFVESPIGVGFSYTNTSSDFTQIDDKFVAEDTYNFLVNWLKKFPQFKGHDFYISGESYAGHYVPQLAELVYDRNKDPKKYPCINLKGFIVGNPETNDYFDYKGVLEYAWSHSVISDQEYHKARRACDFKLENWSAGCVNAMTVVFDRYKEIDIYNIYAPSCLLNKTSSFADGIVGENDFSNIKAQSHGFRRMRLFPGGYDPCYSTHVEQYFNHMDVQNALHINSGRLSDSVKWTVCNDSVFRTYKYGVFSVFPIYRKLIKGGLKIWMYSGDADGRVPVIGSRYCVEALDLPLKTPWTSWFHKHQVAGRIVEYEGLTFVTVRGAGHLVPLNKPREALALIHSYLSGEPLPTHR